MSAVLHPSPSPVLDRLDSLAAWRRALDRGLERLLEQCAVHGLLDAAGQALGQAVRQRLASDRLVLAFVAEFSRGKSELINALFFADSGRRVLPAAPGRTTMCPVELGWDPAQPPQLSLLPIATRRSGRTLASLRDQPDAWQRLPLPLDDADALAAVLQQVASTQRVTADEARALGLCGDGRTEAEPPNGSDGFVELPAWRHALVNFPHPLLQRGLVVVDTPGLNAIGAEPELTLALLPAAHATVFVLAADAGVTRSDLAVWQEHLGDRGLERFVVLNKIDTLEDPLLDAAQIEAQVRSQCERAAQTLGVGSDRVFALSARRALAARVAGDAAALAASRLPALEDALLARLLPQRRQVIGRIVEDGVLALHQAAQRRVAERLQHNAGQGAELRGLRGKSGHRLQLVAARLAAEVAAFEQSGPRLVALRSVLARQTQAVLDAVSGDRVRQAVRRMHRQGEASFLRLGSARAFQALGAELQALLADAERGCGELAQLLQASQQSLNAEFGFQLAPPPPPELEPFRRELGQIEAGFGRYLGLSQVWRLSSQAFSERFSRLLLSRLRSVFEGAAGEIERWAHAAGTQIDDQVRERRRQLAQQRAAHARIRDAKDGLERSIDDLDTSALQLRRLADSLAADVEGLCQLASRPPAADAAPRPPLLQLVPGGMASPARGPA
ncbi:MAG: dynamin family protein [Burkholderiaceae bacterium]|nr:dynamin family protein [Burkholderiaceae bacterium]